MFAIATRTFVDGIVVSAWRAMPALRILVSISLIGSLTLIRPLSFALVSEWLFVGAHGYQLDFVTPGRRPIDASSRKQIRQSPNFRMYARLRPQRWQRFTWRV